MFLIMSLVANIGILSVFKYYNFFIDNFNEVLALLHLSVKPLPFWNVILPLGLSFHTFQAMSYTLEIYRGNQRPERHFGIYALYVMFYPQLVAGPIERPQNIMHQYREYHPFNPDMFWDGMRLMLWGLFKKVVIADRLAYYVNTVYASPAEYHSLNIVVAMVFFAFQIYCDFSGYSDIALGAARSMGFRLMVNFNRPFLYATSITEFWRRWHISLYTWFNDYLYTPLLIAYREYGKWAIAGGMLFTFFISGLWHGADWAFVIWGLLHGSALVYEMLTKKARKKASKSIPSYIYTPLSLLLTFIVLNLIWVFFRAGKIQLALLIFKSLAINMHLGSFKWFIGKTFGIHSLFFSVFFIALMMVVERFTSPDLTEFNKKRSIDLVFCALVLTFLISFGVFTSNSFIYFQF
jgi:alginate O-acetyltransferase complex protein AlgI